MVAGCGAWQVRSCGSAVWQAGRHSQALRVCCCCALCACTRCCHVRTLTGCVVCRCLLRCVCRAPPSAWLLAPCRGPQPGAGCRPCRLQPRWHQQPRHHTCCAASSTPRAQRRHAAGEHSCGRGVLRLRALLALLPPLPSRLRLPAHARQLRLPPCAGAGSSTCGPAAAVRRRSSSRLPRRAIWAAPVATCSAHAL
jgi:hypothetical protein